MSKKLLLACKVALKCVFVKRLAWQADFRTLEWGKAVGDLETTKREIEHLLSLV